MAFHKGFHGLNALIVFLFSLIKLLPFSTLVFTVRNNACVWVCMYIILVCVYMYSQCVYVYV